MSRKYAIDSLAVRDSRAFGWGWYLDDAAPARAIHLRLCLADGRTHELRCPQTGSRPDLAEAYPQVAHAGGGGFMLQARLPAAVVEAALRVELADGRIDEIALPGFPGAYAAEAASKGRMQRLWPLLRDGDWDALWRRFTDWWLRRGTGASARSAMPSANGARWVVFDHAMGGGSNHFRNEKLAEWRAAGLDVVLVTPRLSTLEYDISGIDARGDAWMRRHPDLTRCLAALGACAQVVVNDLPSFDDPPRVLDWALARQREGARILFYLHDFHAACPAWTLTGSDGRDCGLPEFAQCERCLPANPAPFLGMLPALDVPAWRETWGRFLARADEIVAFSPSSVRILQRAYPHLDLLTKVEVRPHSTAYLGVPPPPFQPAFGETTTIAVVGAIGEYKGARIVAEMAAIIEREALPARLVVVGSIDGVPPSPVLRVTGPYKTDELLAILGREGVDVAFLPSIWHETFSYVTAELMHYRVPLAVFDLGAPAERVRTYPFGRIISAIDARTALAEILEFHRSLGAATLAPAPVANSP